MQATSVNFLGRVGLFQQIAGKARTVFSLAGVYPRVFAPVKSNDGSLDFHGVDKMLRNLDRFPLAGYAVFDSGSDKAAAYRKLQLLSHARRYLGSHRIILATVPDASLESVKALKAAGADAALLMPHSSSNKQLLDKTTNHAFIDLVKKLADQSAIPLILHKSPKDYLPVDTVCELAVHPNIAGLLDDSADIAQLGLICMKTLKLSTRSNPFHIVVGSANYFLPALAAGCSGAICSMAHVLPFEICHLQDLYEEGNIREAQKVQWRLLLSDEEMVKQQEIIEAASKSITLEAEPVSPPPSSKSGSPTKPKQQPSTHDWSAPAPSKIRVPQRN